MCARDRSDDRDERERRENAMHAREQRMGAKRIARRAGVL